MTTKFELYIQRKVKECGPKFDQSDLSKQFIPHYNSGRRIEVNTAGEIKRGTIGVTTGWRPCFLLMLRSNSTGSSYTLSDKDVILRVIR